MVVFLSINCSLRRLYAAITPCARCGRQSLCDMMSDGKSDPCDDLGQHGVSGRRGRMERGALVRGMAEAAP